MGTNKTLEIKVIAGGMFKSTTTNGMKSMTKMGIVTINGEPTIHVVQHYFARVPDKSAVILRQCGNYFYCENSVSMRFNSFLTLLDFVDKNKELVYNEIELNNKNTK